jgi:hypothetical protein
VAPEFDSVFRAFDHANVHFTISAAAEICRSPLDLHNRAW